MFSRLRHHQPWLLFEQTQSDHMSLAPLSSGTYLQLMAMSECGVISTVSTRIEFTDESSQNYKQGSESDQSSYDENRYSKSAPRNNLSVEKRSHLRDRYNTLARINANASVISASQESYDRFKPIKYSSSFIENNWKLRQNATVSSSDLIAVTVWWDDRETIVREYADLHGQVKPTSYDGVVKYMVSWEDDGSAVNGHSVTTNTHGSFFLWPQSTYKIQVKVISGDQSNPRFSEIVNLNASELYTKWVTNEVPSEHAPEPSRKFERSWSDDVYANVDKNYAPQSVKASSVQSVLLPVDNIYDQMYSYVDEHASKMSEDYSDFDNNLPDSSNSAHRNNDHPTEQMELSTSSEEKGYVMISTEILSGIIGSLVMIILIVIAVMVYTCRNYVFNKNNLREAVKTDEVVDTSPYRSSVKDGYVLTDMNPGKCLPNRNPNVLVTNIQGSRPSSVDSSQNSSRYLLNGDPNANSFYESTVLGNAPGITILNPNETNTCDINGFPIRSTGTIGSTLLNPNETITCDINGYPIRSNLTGPPGVRYIVQPGGQVALPRPSHDEYSNSSVHEYCEIDPAIQAYRLIDGKIYTIPGNVPPNESVASNALCANMTSTPLKPKTQLHFYPQQPPLHFRSESQPSQSSGPYHNRIPSNNSAVSNPPVNHSPVPNSYPVPNSCHSVNNNPVPNSCTRTQLPVPHSVNAPQTFSHPSGQRSSHITGHNDMHPSQCELRNVQNFDAMHGRQPYQV